MSEYWKSTPKYWCKHCTAYIRDTLFERKQHESTAKHQNNLKRFLRDIQNDHERGEREKDRAKAEVERLNRITGGGITPSTPQSSAPSIRKEKPAPLTAADQKRQWQQLADMGIQVPDHARGEMAMTGNWRVVTQPKFEQEPVDERHNFGVRKRKLDEDEETAGEEASRPRYSGSAWGRSTKIFPGSENDDLESLLSTEILFKKDKIENDTIPPKSEPVDIVHGAHSVEAPNSDRPTEPLAEYHESAAPSEAPRAIVRVSSGSVGHLLVKGEAVDQEKSKLESNNNALETHPMPVFKKRKGKGNPAR